MGSEHLWSINDLKAIVIAHIRRDEKLGEKGGCSGHLSQTSYNLAQIETPRRIQHPSGAAWKVIYHYTVCVETEFTYYPDNPPYEYAYRKMIIIDGDGKIIEESEKEGGSKYFETIFNPDLPEL